MWRLTGTARKPTAIPWGDGWSGIKCSVSRCRCNIRIATLISMTKKAVNSLVWSITNATFWIVTVTAGPLAVNQTLPSLVGALALASGDWDGNNDLDLAVANPGASNVVILENDGTGSFSIGATITGQPGASGLAAGDWNGDNLLDLAVANSGASGVVVFLNQ